MNKRTHKGLEHAAIRAAGEIAEALPLDDATDVTAEHPVLVACLGQLKENGHLSNAWVKEAAKEHGISRRQVWRYAKKAREDFVADCIDVNPRDPIQARAAQLIRTTHLMSEVESNFAEALKAKDSADADRYDKILERRMRRRDVLCGIDKLSPLHDLGVVETRRFVIDQLAAQVDKFEDEELSRLEQIVAKARRRKYGADAKQDADEPGDSCVLDKLL